MSEGLPSMQSTSNAGGHAEDDERYHDLFKLAVNQSLNNKEQIDKDLMSECLSHTWLDNKLRRHV